MSDGELEEWLVKFLQTEMDSLMLAYDRAAEEWGRLQADEYASPIDLAVAGWQLTFVSECLQTHDKFARWAAGFLTRQWQRRMERMVDGVWW